MTKLNKRKNKYENKFLYFSEYKSFYFIILIWFILFGENENVMCNEKKNIVENIVENMLCFTFLT